jgi:xanthine dehydrogenase molybdopterin binding subunit/xanthine dehydrogenase small subunit
MALDSHPDPSHVQFLLNGLTIRAEGLRPQTTLLDFLRSRGLTGAKEGCAEGECGACTVLMVGRNVPPTLPSIPRPEAPDLQAPIPGPRSPAPVAAYVPVNSCLLFLPMVAGQEIYTVEALAHHGPLTEVQQAMVDSGGSQCGYCTPGFVMSLFAEQYRPGREGPCAPHAMGGNLCRCTGYRPIRDVALSLGPAPDGAFLDRLSQPAPVLGPAAYQGFARPSTLTECLALLAEHPEARLIAGGTDLAVESNLRLRRFPYLISLEALPELRVFHESESEVEIGAGLTLSEIGRAWTSAPPVWREWLPLFASPLIRNRATLGGNLATASPIGDAAPLLLALDARVRIEGPRGHRTVPLDAFFSGYRKTALEVGELLVSIIVPKPLPAMARFFKAAKRRMDDISTVAACFAFDLNDAGRVSRARFGFGGVAAVPIRAKEAEDAVLGELLDGSTMGRVQEILARTLHPIDDHRGTAAYRLALAQTLVGQVLDLHAETGGLKERSFGDARSREGKLKHAPHEEVSHESARGHVTGEALYTDDLTGRFPQLLHAWPVMAPHAHAKATSLDAGQALGEPGVITTLTAADMPGEDHPGEPLFPSEVMYHQQPVAWVLAETLEAAQRGAARIAPEYLPLSAILTIEDAIAAGSFHSGPYRLQRAPTLGANCSGADPPVRAGRPRPAADNGDHSESSVGHTLACPDATNDPPVKLQGELHIGGQEHFYLETQSALAWLDESGGVALHSSTQHPSETQDHVARALGLPSHQVTVECLRMGGAFGGKETQANSWAAIAALGAWKTRRPVRVRLPRVLDMALTGKRHPFLARFAAEFQPDGRLRHLSLLLYSDGGWSLDLSDPVLWRAMFHLDNAYYLPSVEVTGYVCRTHKTSQTAFRGFGGPQGMLVIEDILDRAARMLGLPPEVVRERNFYREGQTTHYGQPVKDAGRIHTIWRQLLETSQFAPRREDIRIFNASHRHRKRGMAITPVKFGISFTATFFNQGGALVLIYKDGSVQVNHGGTEMGQGLHTKIRRIAAESLGLPLDAIRIMPTRTDKVPNTSASAASASTDLNGAAVADACRQLRQRLAPIAGAMLACPPEAARFSDGWVFAEGDEQLRRFHFRQVVEAAYRQRLPLFAEGYYRTPHIHFDQKTGRGQPFHYFAYGAAVSEVEVDGFTGDSRVLRVDILEDVGDSVAPLIDVGQIEGGFIQGLGWLTIEELLWDQQGRLATNSASTYKLPSWSELPEEFNVAFLERATEPDVIFGSKAVGEPPLMLAISAREAIRDAIAAFGSSGVIALDSPLTPERIFWASRAGLLACQAPTSTSPPPLANGELPLPALLSADRHPTRRSVETNLDAAGTTARATKVDRQTHDD